MGSVKASGSRRFKSPHLFAVCLISIAAGCDPSGLLATKLSEKVAGLVASEKVDVKAKVDAQKKVAEAKK